MGTNIGVMGGIVHVVYYQCFMGDTVVAAVSFKPSLFSLLVSGSMGRFDSTEGTW